MKKLLLAGFSILAVLQLNAQNYQITFTGSGAATTVTSVIVDNITAGTTLTLSGTDILNLTTATGVNSPEYNRSSNLKVFPNPMIDYATLEVYPPVDCNGYIIINDIAGKSVAMKQVNLDHIGQSFKLSGLKNGIYFVNVKGEGFQYSAKLLSNANSRGIVSIENCGSIVSQAEEKETTKVTRDLLATIQMAYTTGDRLRFTGSSGNYRTIVMDVPTSSKNIDFNFVLCRDADFNIYPVVTIGTQVWMAQNLKTTKYNDGTTAIPDVTDNATWAGLTTGAYCDYNNITNYSDTYGRLYNWYAVAATNTKNVCPTGWHVSTDAEWTTLTTFLGGASAAGGKLKETGTSHWTTPNAATNETGFTALPGGERPASGTPFGLMGSNGYWWTSTEATAISAFYRNIINSTTSITSVDNDKHAGFYVRCVKD